MYHCIYCNSIVTVDQPAQLTVISSEITWVDKSNTTMLLDRVVQSWLGMAILSTLLELLNFYCYSGPCGMLMLMSTSSYNDNFMVQSPTIYIHLDFSNKISDNMAVQPRGLKLKYCTYRYSTFSTKIYIDTGTAVQQTIDILYFHKLRVCKFRISMIKYVCILIQRRTMPYVQDFVSCDQCSK